MESINTVKEITIINVAKPYVKILKILTTDSDPLNQRLIIR
jgi:hypothetical protein